MGGMSKRRPLPWLLDAALMIAGPLLAALLIYWFFSPIWFPGFRE